MLSDFPVLIEQRRLQRSKKRIPVIITKKKKKKKKKNSVPVQGDNHFIFHRFIQMLDTQYI